MMRMLLLSSSVNPDAYRVLTFNNESQFREIITAFVKRGIDRNQINVLIIYRKEEQKFLQSLDKLKVFLT
ncbi:MAG: hypothetical protein WA421_13105 [Nitrososphaeraceae archaeon]